jgi:hypothetical protein
MTSNRHETKQSLVTLCQTLIAGILALPDKSFIVSGTTMTKQQIVALLKAYIAAVALTVQRKAAYSTAVAAENVAEAKVQSLVDSLELTLRGRLGKQSPDLKAQFGLEPVRVPVKTVEVKAEAAVKARATRTAKKGEPVPPATPTTTGK